MSLGVERGGGGFRGGGSDDWQKMSGPTHQLHTDTQQARVTRCMIRGEDSKEGSGVFTDLGNPSELSHTKSFVLRA